jgi:hypothetical protein
VPAAAVKRWRLTLFIINRFKWFILWQWNKNNYDVILSDFQGQNRNNCLARVYYKSWSTLVK